MRYSHNIKTGNVNIRPVGKHPKWQANVFRFPESDVGVTGGLPWRLKEKWYNRRNDGKRSAAHIFEFCPCHRLQSQIIFPNGGQRCGRFFCSFLWFYLFLWVCRTDFNDRSSKWLVFTTVACYFLELCYWILTARWFRLSRSKPLKPHWICSCFSD